MSPQPKSSAEVREITRKFVAPLACTESVDAILLAITEAVSNCIRHAGTNFRVELINEPDHIVAVISDSGLHPFDGNLYQPPLPGTQDGKLGVPLMRSIMDDAVWRADRGTEVTMKKAKIS